MDVFKSENLLLPLKLCQDKLQKQKITPYLQRKEDLNSHRTFKRAENKESQKSPDILAAMHNTVIWKAGEQSGT